MIAWLLGTCQAVACWLWLWGNVTVIQMFHNIIKYVQPWSFIDVYLTIQFCHHETKRAFVEVIALMCLFFHPTSKMYLYGDDILPPRNPRTGETQNAIFLANHQLYADWVYLWMLLMDRGWHGYLKIMLKNELRHVPMLGWGMDLYEFIFLKRSWAQDKLTMKEHFRRMRADRYPISLLLFPEGTVICEETMEKCRQYAAKHSLPFNSRHVLMPRSTGLEFCVRHLMPGGMRSAVDGRDNSNSIKYVYDLTVAFGGMTGVETPMDQYTLSGTFYRRKAPPSIHIRIKRLPIDQLCPLIALDFAAGATISSSSEPAREESEQQALLSASSSRSTTLNHQSPEFDSWLIESYKRKDEEMARFYKNGKLDGEPRRVIEFASKQWAAELLTREFAIFWLYCVLAIFSYIFYSLYNKFNQ